MKWINLTEQKPNKEYAVIRDIKTKVCIDWMKIRLIDYHTNLIHISEEICDWEYPLNEYEWLDESYDLLSKIEELPRMSFFISMENSLDRDKVTGTEVRSSCNLNDPEGNYIKREDVLNLLK